MTLLIAPEHKGQIERHFRALRAALKYYGLWYGPYPYETVTMVDPPFRTESGGMEYPTLFTAGTRILPSRNVLSPEGVIVHEFGHGYWYGLAANNEFEAAWLDEGFNTYSTGKVLAKAYGPGAMSFVFKGFPLDWFLRLPRIFDFELNRAAAINTVRYDPVTAWSWKFYNSGSYGANVYMRAATLLETLERLLGEPAWSRIMRTYHMRYRFKHPAKSDFVAVVNELSGKDMTWFFDELFEGTEAFDYGIASVSSAKVPLRRRGVYDADGARTEWTGKKIAELEKAGAGRPRGTAAGGLPDHGRPEALRGSPARGRRAGRGPRPLQGRDDRDPDLGRAGPLGPAGVRQAGRGRERRDRPRRRLADRREPGQQQPRRRRPPQERRQDDHPAPVPAAEPVPFHRIVDLRRETMGVFKAIANGLGTTVRKPLVLAVLYAVNVVFSAAAAAPFLTIAQTELGHSLLGSSVRPADLMWLGETALKYGDALPALLAGLLVAAAPLPRPPGLPQRRHLRPPPRQGGQGDPGAFAGDCGRYFGRFTRIFLVSLVFLFLTFGIVLELVSALIGPAMKSAPTEWLPLILSNAHFLIALLLLSVVHMVVDYTRIAVVADDERRVLKALRHALIFLKRRFFRAWALYLLIVGAALAGTVALSAALGPLGGPGPAPVVAAFAVMQIYILFRLLVRMLFVAAQAEFYRSHPY